MDPILTYIGEIKQFSGDFVPRGWALCDGQLLPKDQHELLFDLIGTQFGGDGVNNFAVPDLRGRVPLHYSNTYPLASKGGQEEVTLTEAQLPSHSHVAYASSNSNPNTIGPENAYWGTLSSAFTWTAGPGDMIMHPDTIRMAGQGLAHENRIPFVAISYIISLEGVYPQEG